MQADMRVLRLDDGPVLARHSSRAPTDAVVRHLSDLHGRAARSRSPTDAERAILSRDRARRGRELAGAGPLRPEHAHRELRGRRRHVPRRRHRPRHRPDLRRRPRRRAVDRGPASRRARSRSAEAAAEILRVEAGRPRFGARDEHRHDPARRPASTSRAVSFTKGCYIGQETVARLHYKGKPNRHLRGLRLDAPVTRDDAIALDGRDVGRIGTAVVSPALGPIALAVIRREAEPGALVEVGESGVGGQVVDLPFGRTAAPSG